MNLRTKSILEAAVKEYIRTGQPVSSKELAEHYDFGIKWASVRSELGRLTRAGYLSQRHTSGGRVPTDKGYQFFVEETFEDTLVSKEILGQKPQGLAENLRSHKLKDLVESLASETHLLGVGQEREEAEVYKSGLEDLFQRLDWESKNELQEIIRDFEQLDGRLENFRRKIRQNFKEPQIFIGKRSPITRNENLSVVLDSYGSDDGCKVIVAIIGPKRMDYRKNFYLLKNLHD